MLGRATIMKPRPFPDGEFLLDEFDIYTNELAVVICSPMLADYPIIYANDKFLEHSGYSRNEIVGKNCRFMQGPDSEKEAIAAFRECIAANKSANVRITNNRKDGTKFIDKVLMRPLTKYGDHERLFVALQRRIHQ
jgi:PAS domain S-box-containing protein